MKVWELLRNKGSNVFTMSPNRTVYEAVELFNEHGIGAVVVLDEEGRIAGILTERDVLRRCLKSCSPDLAVPIGEHMTTKLIVGVPEDTAAYVMGIMTKNRIRHLPIVDGGKLVGILSIGDVVKVQLEESEYENRFLLEYIHGNHP